MADRATSEGISETRSLWKARKKTQAFGLPKTASVKAIIKCNSLNSPLLRLPLEIRRRVWAFALGDKLLHIARKRDYLNEGRIEDREGWSVTLCTCPYTERQLFKRSKMTVHELVNIDNHTSSESQGASDGQNLLSKVSTKISPIDTTQPPKPEAQYEQSPHLKCRETVANNLSAACHDPEDAGILRKRRDAMLSVQLLRVCRQVYMEADPLLWKANTFSFCEPEDATNFMSERNSSQKTTITRVHYELQPEGVWQSSGSWAWVWKPNAGAHPLIKSLKNLNELSICINYGSLRPGITKEQLIARHARLGGMESYRILNLKSVYIVVIFSEPPHVEQIWPRAERTAIAEALRQKILDPEGLQKYEEEQVRMLELARRRKAYGVSHRRMFLCKFKASTEEECAKLRRANRDAREQREGRKMKTQRLAGDCECKHVCQICLREKRLRQYDSARCMRPGKCNQAPSAEELKELTARQQETPERNIKIHLVAEIYGTLLLTEKGQCMVAPTTLMEEILAEYRKNTNIEKALLLAVVHRIDQTSERFCGDPGISYHLLDKGMTVYDAGILDGETLTVLIRDPRDQELSSERDSVPHFIWTQRCEDHELRKEYGDRWVLMNEITHHIGGSE